MDFNSILDPVPIHHIVHIGADAFLFRPSDSPIAEPIRNLEHQNRVPLEETQSTMDCVFLPMPWSLLYVAIHLLFKREPSLTF
jgi:hypothetical protein